MWLQAGDQGIMAQPRPEPLYAALSQVPDHRQYNTVHPLASVLALCICAMLCGARSKFAIAQWGREHAAQIGELLGFHRSTPCHASIHNVLKRVNLVAFESALSCWVNQFLPAKKSHACAIDGKKLRGIHGELLPGVHLVALLSHELGLPLAQIGATDKEGELTAARELLERLDLHGIVLTGDALYTQRDVCERVVEKGGTTSSR
jgi:hypothetical protein